ncbi:unnamed protein product [Amoebophrya sp. A120]|nr:unnamed protein product [Amoebophrya sp. A120]|eukprot:GSA120T00018110001.1
MKLERVVTLLSWTGLLAADAVHVRVGIATGIAESSQDVGTNARGKNMLLSARLQTRADLKEITQQEATLQKHISRVYSLFEFTKELLLNEEMGGRSPNNKNTAARVDITASMPADVKAAYEQLQKNDKAALGRKGMVGNLMMSKAMGPAIMVPLLQEMYEKFKGDIKRANAQEKRAADRVSKQEKEYVAFQNEGKSYLLEQKKKVIDYYKKQREIQHHHYHTMLKMAHAMMQRITKVKQMCADAANGKKLSAKQLEELRLAAPSTKIVL